ncbi:MAG: HIT family protein [Candidatus Omnitrophica bacterium]|nr:HIT family protein [Candidatus Omnitrophota bacterium]
MSDCIFCKNLPRVAENEAAYALYDIQPISAGHTLIIFKRHFENIFEASREEWGAAQELLNSMKAELHKQHKPDGFNVWINCGKAAGQVVMHAHIHLIPRFNGQVIHIKEHLKGNIE